MSDDFYTWEDSNRDYGMSQQQTNNIWSAVNTYNQSMQYLDQKLVNQAVANQNYKLNNRAQKEMIRQYEKNFEYTEMLNNLNMARADTYYSRMSKDLESAGINPRVLTGNAAPASTQGPPSAGARSTAPNRASMPTPPGYTSVAMSQDPLVLASIRKMDAETRSLDMSTARERQATSIDSLNSYLEAKKVDIMASNMSEQQKLTSIRKLEAEVARFAAIASAENASGSLQQRGLESLEQSRQFEKSLSKTHQYDELHAGLATSAAARDAEKHQWQISEIASRIDSTTAKTVAQKIENILTSKIGTTNRGERDYIARVLIDNGLSQNAAYKAVESRQMLAHVLKSLESIGAAGPGWKNKGTGGKVDTKLPQRDPWITN